MHIHFLDPFRPGVSLVHSMDGRVKFVLTLAFILTAALTPGMENGPFPGFNASFSLSGANLITPVPEASTYGMMLAGLGLVGFAVRRRKLMA